MLYQLKNGNSAIKIFATGNFLSYFMYNDNIVTVEWTNHNEPYMYFFCSLSYVEAYRIAVNDSLDKNILYNDFTSNEKLAVKHIEPLLRLFEDGMYKITFSNSTDKSFFKYNGSLSLEYYKWEFLIRQSDIHKPDEEKARQEFEIEATNKNFKYQDILGYTTSIYCSTFGIKFLMATISEQYINAERVDFFKQEIKNGKRPFIAVYQYYTEVKDITSNSDYDRDVESEIYVVDGHHKLLAYKELNIYPPILSIISFKESKYEAKCDINELKQVLYSWQIEDIENMIKKFK